MTEASVPLSPQYQEMLGVSRVVIERPKHFLHEVREMATAARLDRQSESEDGMLNPESSDSALMTEEQLQHWIRGEFGPLWWISSSDKKEEAAGFVFAYKDEHASEVRQALEASNLGMTAKGKLLELSSYLPGDRFSEEADAIVQSVSSLLRDRKVDVISIYITHDDHNQLIEAEKDSLERIGFHQLFTFHYSEEDSVDTSCFVLDGASFFRALQNRQSKE